MVQKILLGLIGILIIIQFIGIDKDVPKADPAFDFIKVYNPPLEVSEILVNSCYDCHSYDTQYPWYSNIAPVSWWIGHHIEEGREELNFSTFRDYEPGRAMHKLEEMYEVVDFKEMPLESYTWMHTEAKLTKENRKTLVKWIQSIPGVMDQD